ncbi:MAG: hypothetical protein VXZ72_00810 [Chlamydiota bacterium]|nr:hypothetical protein [Chlamydiota bacterium]
MAITQEEIEKAVARYLPDSLNYSQNASGDVDDEALFKKLLQMMALSLALDENSVTYLVYLSVQRLGNSVDAVISILTNLMGDQQLLAAGADDPVQITDFSNLTAARNTLLSMDSDLANGQNFSQEKLDFFNAEIESFLTTQLSQNVKAKNLAKVKLSLKGSMKSLADAWSEMRAKREQVFKIVDEFFDVDVKSIAIQSVLASSHQSLTASLSALSGSTADGQGELADDLLVSIAAIKAVLEAVTNTPTIKGTPTIAPARSEGEGSLPKTFMQVRGNGSLVPRDFVATSSTGRPFVNYTIGGNKGYFGSSSRLEAMLVAPIPGPYTFTGSPKLLKFTATQEGADGKSEDFVRTATWTPSAAAQSGINAEALAAELNALGMSNISGAYTTATEGIYFRTDSSATSLIIANANDGGFRSSFKIHNTTADSFVSVLGVDTETTTRGNANSKNFYDSLMDDSASDGSRHFGTYCGLGRDVGILEEVHDDIYYLCLKRGPKYRILEVKTGFGGSPTYLVLSTGGVGLKGYDSSASEGTEHWIITKDRPYGSYVYSEGAVKTPVKSGYPNGQVLSSGTHWKVPSSGGVGRATLPTTVMRRPQSSGTTFTGLGVMGFVVPKVKVQGSAKNAYTKGTDGVSAPFEYVGTTGYSRMPKMFGTNGFHGKVKSYAGTGALIKAVDAGTNSIYSGSTGLPAEGVEVGDYLYLSGQSSSPTNSILTGAVAWNNDPFGKSFRIFPVDETQDHVTSSSFGEAYFVLNPEWPAFGGATSTYDSWADGNWGANSSLEYDKIEFSWVDSSYFRVSGGFRGFLSGDTDDHVNTFDSGASANPGDYLIFSDIAGHPNPTDADPIEDQAKVFEVQYAVSERELKLWTKPSFQPSYHPDAEDPDYPGNVYYGYRYGNFYKSPRENIDHMWNVTSTGYSGNGLDSTDEPGSKVSRRSTINAWWLMQRGTAEYDFTLPDWWGRGEKENLVDRFGNKPSNDYAWSFGHKESGKKFISDGKIQVGDKLTITDISSGGLQRAGGASIGGAYLIDDWYIYAIGSENRIFIAKTVPHPTMPTIHSVAGPPRYYASNIDWRITKPNYDQIFRSESANFITNGVEAGMTLRIDNTLNHGTYTIASVDSETQVTITGTFPNNNRTGATWWIPMGPRKIHSHEANFVGNVEAGDIVRLYDHDSASLIQTVSGEDEFTVSEVVDNFFIELEEQIAVSDRQFVDASMMIRAKKDDDPESDTYGLEVSDIFLQVDKHYTSAVDFKLLSDKYGAVGPTVTHTDTGESVRPILRLQSWGIGAGYGTDIVDVGIVGLDCTMPLTVQDALSAGTALSIDIDADKDDSQYGHTLIMDRPLAVHGIGTSGAGFAIGAGNNHAIWSPYAYTTNPDRPSKGFTLNIGDTSGPFNFGALSEHVNEFASIFCLWSVFAGTETDRLIDTTSTRDFTTFCSPGEQLFLIPLESPVYPSSYKKPNWFPDGTSARIDTVVSSSLITLKSKVDTDSTTRLRDIRELEDSVTTSAVATDTTLVFPTDYHTSTSFEGAASTGNFQNFGSTRIQYAVLPSTWPNPGMEFISGSTRIPITGISEVDNKTVSGQVCLELERDLPSSIGKDFTFYVVRSGESPFASFFEDSDPRDVEGNLITNAFNSSDLSLVGLDLQYGGRRPGRAKIVEVVDKNTLRLDKDVPLEASEILYRITTKTTGNTDTLVKYLSGSSDVNLTSAQQDDFLTVWTEPSVLTIKSSTQEIGGEGKGSIVFSPRVLSDRSNLYFTTVTGGSRDYGRFLLLDYLNSILTVDSDVTELNLNVAEVIHRQDEQLSLVIKADPTLFTSGDEVLRVVGDGDGDSTSPIVDFSVYTALSSSLTGLLQSTPIRVGDRIELSYSVDASAGASPALSSYTQVAYVTAVNTSGSLQDRISVSPEFRVTSSLTTDNSDLYTTTDTSTSDTYPFKITDWKISRTPISYAFAEADKLKNQAQELRNLIDNYTVASSAGVDNVLSALVENGMDKAVDNLLDGKITEFFQLTSTKASYAAAAKEAIQEIGRLLVEESNG